MNKKIRGVFAALGLTATSVLPAMAQDGAFNPEPVRNLSESCGVNYQTYTQSGGVNTYTPECHEATRDVIHQFYRSQVREYLTFREKMQVDWSCKFDIHKITPESATEGYISSDFRGPYYEALQTYSNCTNLLAQWQAAKGIPWNPNDFNIIAGHISCMNDAGDYHGAPQSAAALCSQLEAVKAKTVGAPRLDKI